MNLATYMKAGPRIGVAQDGTLWDLRSVTMSWLFAVERNVRARSIAEALVPVFVCFGCLTIAWLLVALGMRRPA